MTTTKEERLAKLSQKLFRDLRDHNLISSASAGWRKSPEGIQNFIETYWIKRQKQKGKCGEIMFERHGQICKFTVFVSQRGIKYPLESEGNV